MNVHVFLLALLPGIPGTAVGPGDTCLSHCFRPYIGFARYGWVTDFPKGRGRSEKCVSWLSGSQFWRDRGRSEAEAEGYAGSERLEGRNIRVSERAER